MIDFRRAPAGAIMLLLAGLVGPAQAESLTAAWNANLEFDVAGYIVHYGVRSRTYPHTIDVGRETSVTIPGLVPGQRYYVAVQAYNTAGLESPLSDEVSGVVAFDPTTGLVAAYGFEEAQGLIVTDASPQGNRGTIAGATRTAAGRHGRALSFDGVNDWVTVPDAASLDLRTAMTIEAWVNPASRTGWRTVVMKEHTHGLAYALDTFWSLPVATVDAAHTVSMLGRALLPLDTWTHIAATYDGRQARLFINGTLTDTAAARGAIARTARPLRIGGNALWGDFFRGRIDEVRIYNRALAGSEIARDMGVAITRGGLVAAYGFEEATGTVAADGSGNGNSGVLAGPTRTTAGRFGRGLIFDGDDVVTIADATSLDGTTATVEAWVRPAAATGWRTVLMKEAVGGMVYGLYASDGTDRPSMTVAVNGGDYAAVGDMLPADTWTHLAATYDGASVRLYVNGAVAATLELAGALTPSAQPLRIGGNSVWGEYFIGTIDEVRVYDRVLSGDEIRADRDRAVTP